MSDFTQKHCIPCEGSIPPITRDAALNYLKQISGWTLRETALFQKVAPSGRVNAELRSASLPACPVGRRYARNDKDVTITP